MPPIQWVKLRQNRMPMGRLSTSASTDAPVVVKPDTVSNSASMGSGMAPDSTKGTAPITLMSTQVRAAVTQPSRI